MYHKSVEDEEKRRMQAAQHAQNAAVDASMLHAALTLSLQEMERKRRFEEEEYLLQVALVLSQARPAFAASTLSDDDRQMATAFANSLRDNDAPMTLSQSERCAVELLRLGLVELATEKDGNCLFSAICLCLTCTSLPQHTHETLRRMAVDHVVRHWQRLNGFIVGQSVNTYAASMRQLNTCWGGETEIAALAHELACTIIVYNSVDGHVIRTHNQDGGATTLRVLFTGSHYSALLPRA